MITGSLMKDYFIGEIDLSALIKARKKFELFRQHLNSEQEKAGAIQAFEYCYELAWKMMKRLLEARGVICNSPRDTFREAALNNLIFDPEIWFDFIKARNLTVHTYDEESMRKVLSTFDHFSQELTEFIKNSGISL